MSFFGITHSTAICSHAWIRVAEYMASLVVLKLAKSKSTHHESGGMFLLIRVILSHAL